MLRSDSFKVLEKATVSFRFYPDRIRVKKLSPHELEFAGEEVWHINKPGLYGFLGTCFKDLQIVDLIALAKEKHKPLEFGSPV